jgi:hypothetical protein
LNGSPNHFRAAVLPRFTGPKGELAVFVQFIRNGCNVFALASLGTILARRVRSLADFDVRVDMTNLPAGVELVRFGDCSG